MLAKGLWKAGMRVREAAWSVMSSGKGMDSRRRTSIHDPVMLHLLARLERTLLVDPVGLVPVLAWYQTELDRCVRERQHAPAAVR